MHPTHARQAAALEALLSGGSVDECMPRIPAGRYAKGDGLVITIGSKDGRQTFRLERREQEIEVSLDEQGRPSFQVGPPVWQWGRPTFTLEPGGTLVENKANGTKVEFRLQQQQQAPSPAGAEARAPTRAPVRPPPSPEPKISPAAATAAVAAAAFPLSGGEADYEPLLRSLGEAQFVLLGESTHGTKEFYEHRAAITRRLVSEHGFNVVLVEGEWPAAHRIHRYIGADGGSSDRSAAEALESFEGFPRWMWRNGVTAELAEFLKDHNRQVDGERRDFESARDAKEEMSAAGLTVGQLEEMGILGDQELAEWARRRGRPDSKREVSFYGMDVYSVGASARAVVEFLEIVDPEAAERARGRYSVFNEYGTDMKAYGRDVLIGPLRPMAEEIQANLLSQLGELQRNNRDAYSFLIPPLELLNAEQNAEVVVNGEAYFRDLYTEGSVATWNLRDQHMVQTCLRLAEYHGLGGTAPKVVVWAHNSHCGDASATEIGAHNEWNLGQMLRQTFGSDNTFIVGFGTHEGTVTAADEWGEPAETFELSHAEEGSISSIMHAAMPARRGVAGTAEVAEAFSEPRRQRAIGVCYKRGEREATSHYFHATLTQQVDAWVHVDRSTALAHFDA